MVDMPAATTNEAKDAIKATGATSKTIHMVPVEHIKTAPGFNIRITDGEEYQKQLLLLKQSIATEGFYNTKPLAGFVSKDKDGKTVLYVTDGHRRLEAARLAIADGAEIDRLPVILKSPGTTPLDLTVALYKENMGEKLGMLEQAVLAKRLMASGIAEGDVAMRLGVSPRYVSDLMVLVSGPKEIRALVAAGKMSGTMAVKLMRQNKENAVEKASEMVEKAEAKGKPKATAKDDAPGSGEPSIKMATTTTRVEFEVNQTVKMGDIEPFLPLFGDSDWFALSDVEGEAIISEPIELTIKLRRKKRDNAEAAAEDEAMAEVEKPEPEIDTSKVKPKRAKKTNGEDAPAPAGKKRGRPAATRNLGEAEEDGADELAGESEVTTADLEELGIADPAADL